MREGGLVQRIASATAPAGDLTPRAISPQPRLLNDVARTLREAAEATARKRAQDSARQDRSKPLPDRDRTADDPVTLPQILQHPVSAMSSATAPLSGRRGREQIIAPAVLVSGLLAVALMLSASVVDLGRIPGLAWLADKPRPKLTSLSHPQPSLASSFDASSPSGVVPLVIVPPLTPEEQLLLERCETMIAQGNMPAARRELARAADEGSTNARFALAETYDPNVLAAWGLRERVADVGTAITLYEQALSAGDTRASARMGALQASR